MIVEKIAAHGSRQEIKNLLAVLGSSAVCAVSIAVGMLYYYGPSGQYSAQNMLLSPDILSQISFHEGSANAKNGIKYVFDGIEFLNYAKESKRAQRFMVSEEKYKRFYNLLAGRHSLTAPSAEVQALFQQPYVSKLSLKLKEDNKGGKYPTSSKVFLEVEIVPDGDYFRAQLLVQQPTESWVYFYHPHIYNQVLQLFGNGI